MAPKRSRDTSRPVVSSDPKALPLRDPPDERIVAIGPRRTSRPRLGDYFTRTVHRPVEWGRSSISTPARHVHWKNTLGPQDVLVRREGRIGFHVDVGRGIGTVGIDGGAVTVTVVWVLPGEETAHTALGPEPDTHRLQE
jgi:hypothetical protein